MERRQWIGKRNRALEEPGLPRRRGGRFADSPARHPGSGWRAARQSLMATYTLDFEKPLLELEKQIEELKRVAGENADPAKNVGPLESQLAKLRVEIYRNLTPMQRVQVARHPRRPYPLDYVNTVFTDFVELHGDRLYRDDPAIIGGWARLDGTSVFFFSSRRRHTRLQGDWSSDVCSSDLRQPRGPAACASAEPRSPRPPGS